MRTVWNDTPREIRDGVAKRLDVLVQIHSTYFVH